METPRCVLEYAQEMLSGLKPEALKKLGLDVLAEKIDVAVTQAENATTVPLGAEYTEAHVDAACCMWEHVLVQFGKQYRADNPWLEHAVAHGRDVTRAIVARYSPTLELAYRAAVANGYTKDFADDFVPKHMEDHIARILA